MKRKPPTRCVERKLQLYVGSRVVKTVKTRITTRQATTEIGEERLFTRGDYTRMQRRIGRYAHVVVTWTAVTTTVQLTTHTTGVDTSAAKQIAKKGMIL